MTIRQKLINRLATKINIKEFDGTNLTDHQINELTEDICDTDTGIHKYYLSMTDKQYFRMANEAKKQARYIK